MTEGSDPGDVVLYGSATARDEGYERAQREGEPFFAIERYDEGYAVTYDLLPAGRELTRPIRKEVAERITRETEAIVGDESLPTAEVSKTVGASLGNVSLFQREDSARRVAAAIAGLVLDEANWVEASTPTDARTN